MDVLRHLAFRKRRTPLLVSFSILILLIAAGSAYALASGTKVWTRTTGAGSWDARTDVAVDDHGNIYVLGSREADDTDILLVKYGMAGKLKWRRHYDGPASYEDMPAALATDKENNVYVTGWSETFDRGRDIVTIKYSPQGRRRWIKRYDGGIKKDDSVAEIAVDRNGRVYVVGTSSRKNGSTDYVTIKYDSSGRRIWSRLYNGRGNGADSASAVSYGGAGSVIVTGASEGRGTGRDYATVKYDVDGRVQWVARHNGKASEDDWATDVVVDGNRNVYITGLDIAESAIGILTIKYSRNGKRQWASRHHPRDRVSLVAALVVDSNRNVYVLGRSYGMRFSSIQTIKYGPSGDQRWIRRYGNAHLASDMALGKDGYVFVSGRGAAKYQTIKYSPRGATVWVKKQAFRESGPFFYGPVLAVDNKFGQLYASYYEDYSPGVKTIRYVQ